MENKKILRRRKGKEYNLSEQEEEGTICQRNVEPELEQNAPNLDK